MKFSQTLRRWQWRARRLLVRPADNDPLVAVEPGPQRQAPEPAGAQPPLSPARALRELVRRIVWIFIAFLVTMAALAALYVWFVASESRVAAPLEDAAKVERGAGSGAVLAAASLVTDAIAPADALSNQGMLLAPTARRIRETWLNDGAAAAVGRFLDQLQPEAGRRDAALVEARFALAEGGQGRGAARAALIRFNDRVARGVAVLDVSEPAYAAMLAAAARSLAAEAEALQAIVADGRLGTARPDAERSFFRARGAALAWRRALQGYIDDAPAAVAGERQGAAAPGLEALAEAAAFQPTLLFNAPLDSSFQPNHLASLALKLSLAALRLNAAAESAP